MKLTAHQAIRFFAFGGAIMLFNLTQAADVTGDASDVEWRLGIRGTEEGLIDDLKEFARDDAAVTLYTVDSKKDGLWFQKGKTEKLNRFREYPILGKAEILSRDQRNRLIASLIRGISEWDGGVWSSLSPHFALTITGKTKKMDLLLGFGSNCGEVWGSYSCHTFATTRWPVADFDTISGFYDLPKTAGNK